VRDLLIGATKAAAFGVTLASTAVMTAMAGANDYEFQLLRKDLKTDVPAEIIVRLVHKPDGKPVPQAVVFSAQLDMRPDGMYAMTAPVEKMAGGEPGIYRFKAKATMNGTWAFSLVAKVQGEPETVHGRFVIKAQP
jgi:hypothetical protein